METLGTHPPAETQARSRTCAGVAPYPVGWKGGGTARKAADAQCMKRPGAARAARAVNDPYREVRVPS